MFKKIKHLNDSSFLKIKDKLKIIDYDYTNKSGKLIVYGNSCYACKEHNRKYVTKETNRYKDGAICSDNENCSEVVQYLNINYIPKIFDIIDSGEGYSYIQLE